MSKIVHLGQLKSEEYFKDSGLTCIVREMHDASSNETIAMQDHDSPNWYSSLRETTSLPLGEITSRTGFCGASHLSRALAAHRPATSGGSRCG